MIDVIEDALLSALEEGARPPAEFSIHIPWEAWLAVGSAPLRIAGFTVHILGGWPISGCDIWRH